jgi:aminopeptidase
MFTKKQLDRYADVLLWGLKKARRQKMNKAEVFLIRYNLPALKLAEILHAKLLGMDMNTILRMDSTPRMEKSFFELSNPKQLIFQPPGEKAFYNGLNGSIFLHAPESITHLSHIDPKKIGKAAVARKYIRDILEKREEQGTFSWTLCIFPTLALAKHAGLSLNAYTDQVIKSCFLNRRSPTVEWERIYKNAVTIKKWLNRLPVSFYHIESKNCDLKITPGEKRKWIGLSGHNIPSFELFISPDWRGISGNYFADQPSYRTGNLVKGVKLVFKNGNAVEIQAEQGLDFVKKQLSMDQGAKRVGEFSLTDKRFSKINTFMANTLFDENYGGKFGNCHIALGSSYSDTYDGDTSKLNKRIKSKLGFNDSALHWDLVNTEKKLVTAHLKGGRKKVIYENGRFKY